MIGPQQLVGAFARNLDIIKMQTQGMTQEETLLQLPFRGNCMNWVLGHIAVHRDRLLLAMGQPPLLEQFAARYGHDSPPVTGDGPDVLCLADLLAVLERAQQAIAAALPALSEQDLTRQVQSGQRTVTLAERLLFLYFHETYHVGQTELLRQLAGKNDKVI